MARIGKTLSDPEDKLAIVDIINQIVRVLDDANIEFGDPLSPLDDSSVVLAGAGTPTTHNGRLANIRGSWVEAQIDAANAVVTFTHNLDLPVVGADEPNVRWAVLNFKHSGVGAAPGALQLVYEDSVCTVTANTIDLVLRVEGTRTLAAGANAVRASVFFIPCVRWT